MHDPPLGYAQRFVGNPRLRPRHTPIGTHRTPPAIEGVAVVKYRGIKERYKFGYRIRPDGMFDLVHVGGVVFPHDRPNTFENCRAGIVAFLAFTNESEMEMDE